MSYKKNSVVYIIQYNSVVS